MLHKAAPRGQERLPHMKEKQNHNIRMKFLEYFSMQDRQYIKWYFGKEQIYSAGNLKW